MTTARAGAVLDEIKAERERQISVEGWTSEHDDRHKKGEIAFAAATYAVTSAIADRSLPDYISYRAGVVHTLWPWDWTWFKPSTSRRDLIKAAALIVAEIERLDRASTGAGLGEGKADGI